MDVLLSILTGLGLRIFLGGLDEALGKVSPALLGLWEGAAIHHLSNSNKPSSSDQYLAFALRLAVDLVLTGNLQRMFIVLLWTTLGAVAAESVKPARYYESKRERRRRSSRSVPARVRVYHSPITPQLSQTPLAHTPPSRPPPRDISPQLSPSRPPSHPSFFLDGESDISSNSPQLHYLPSVFDEGESDSPLPKPVLLPTPPATLVPEGRDANNDSRFRLSTIEELSGEESSRIDHLAIPGGHNAFSRPTSYAPSVATSAAPIPVPNSTIRYIQRNVSHQSLVDNSDLEDMYAPLADATSAPLPVPNPGTQYVQPSSWRPRTPSEPDELMTPQATNWDLTDHDELRTPSKPSKELSPLFSDQHMLPDFSSAKPVEPPTMPIPVPASPPPPQAPAVISSTITSTTVVAPSNVPTPAVEYFSPAVPNGSELSPDVDKMSEAESAQTETDATSVITIRNAAQLYSKAELLRKLAREKEIDRLRLVDQLTVATNQARIKDVLFLREEIRLAEIDARKLHERAARRFYKGELDTLFTFTVSVFSCGNIYLYIGCVFFSPKLYTEAANG